MLLLLLFSAVNGGEGCTNHAVLVTLYQKLSWRSWPEAIVSCRHTAHHMQLQGYTKCTHDGQMDSLCFVMLLCTVSWECYMGVFDRALGHSI